MARYLVNILYALDLLAAAIVGGRRHETLSAIAGISQKSIVEKLVFSLLDAVQSNHCELAAQTYKDIRAVLPKGEQ